MSFKDYLKETIFKRQEPIKDIEDAYNFGMDILLPKRPVREGNIDYAIGEIISLDKNKILSISDVTDLKNRFMSKFRLNF